MDSSQTWKALVFTWRKLENSLHYGLIIRLPKLYSLVVVPETKLNSNNFLSFKMCFSSKQLVHVCKEEKGENNRKSE